MLLLQYFSKKEVHRRFRTYRRSSAVFSIVFFLAFLLGVVLTTAYLATPRGIDSAELFGLHWQSRDERGLFEFCLYGFLCFLPYLLVSLVFGITIYAPVSSALCVAVCAFVQGGYLRFLIGYLYVNSGCFPALYYGLGLFLIAALIVAANAFGVCASFRCFTPRLEEAREQDQMFGGTLFCAPYYRSTINLRFLFSYLAFFCIFAILLWLLCLLQSAMVLML